MTLTKADLIAAAKDQWMKSEAAIAQAAKGNFDGAPAGGGWSASDTFRHIIDSAHRTPEMMEGLVKTGSLGNFLETLDGVNAEGIESFKTLKARMLPIELNTAHGIVWMAMQKLTAGDLAKKINFQGNEMALGDMLEFVLIGHEKSHVEAALKTAGVA
ncbi:MAG: DinB family protein [Dehalococcoidia bacterium]